MYESVFSLWAVVMGRGNLVKHAAGWLEGGLCSSFEKLVIDVDTLQMVAAFLEPLVVDEASLGPGRHPRGRPGRAFLRLRAHARALPHRLLRAARLRLAQLRELARGRRPDAARHAHRIYKEVVAAYEPPPIDPGVKEELDAFVARRIQEGGAPNEF